VGLRYFLPGHARLSGKRPMVPWNALPGVERQRKVGGREVLID